MRRPPLSVAALRLLGAVERRPGLSAAEIAAEHGARAWQLLATLRGRYFVRWDRGGAHVRVTESGRGYLRGRANAAR